VKKLNIHIDRQDIQNIGTIVFEQLKKYIKSNKKFSNDQLCRLAYIIAHKQLAQRLNNASLFDVSEFYNVLQNSKRRLAFQKEKLGTREDQDFLGVY
jgi:hypothetical protein